MHHSRSKRGELGTWEKARSDTTERVEDSIARTKASSCRFTRIIMTERDSKKPSLKRDMASITMYVRYSLCFGVEGMHSYVRGRVFSPHPHVRPLLAAHNVIY